MKLYFKNHAYKFAAEQMMTTLFPGELPTYPAEPPLADDMAATLSLTQGRTWATGKTTLRYKGNVFTCSARVTVLGLEGPLELDRARQKALKLSFYRVGVAALGAEPPWGSLTGVRPVKIPTQALLSGKNPAQAEAVLRDVYRVTPMRRALAMDCAGASIRAMDSLKSDEVSLYVGIPFCPTRCAYCSFVSADVGRTLKLVAPYLTALALEIKAAGEVLRRTGLHVRTVYIGGGTPTTLSAEQLTALMGEIRTHIDLSRCTEYTVEAGRPDTISAPKLAAIKAGGAGRISVNPQTMHDHVLAAMGRAHTAEDILSAYALVRQGGIPAVNMDLIAGLPEDTAEGFRTSLDAVLALRPENITVHTLAMKKGSRLTGNGDKRGDPTPALPDGGEVSAMLDYASAALRGSGYVPYYLYRQKYMSGSFENVGWCKPGYESLYNIAMMEELHSVVALGGGGVTKLVDPSTGKIQRMSDPKYPHEYMRDIHKLVADKEALADFYTHMRRD